MLESSKECFFFFFFSWHDLIECGKQAWSKQVVLLRGGNSFSALQDITRGTWGNMFVWFEGGKGEVVGGVGGGRPTWADCKQVAVAHSSRPQPARPRFQFSCWLFLNPRPSVLRGAPSKLHTLPSASREFITEARAHLSTHCEQRLGFTPPPFNNKFQTDSKRQRLWCQIKDCRQHWRTKIPSELPHHHHHITNVTFTEWEIIHQ